LKSRGQNSDDSKQRCINLIFSFINEGFAPVILQGSWRHAHLDYTIANTTLVISFRRFINAQRLQRLKWSPIVSMATTTFSPHTKESGLKQ